MRRLVAAVAASVLVLSACAPAREGPDERSFSLQGVRMRPCSSAGADAVCGRLTVPEDRSDPSRTIDLSVVVIPAVTAEPADDPVFFLAGGPGGASTELWAGAAEAFPEIHRTRDIVLVDQRGTGDSNELVFPDTPDLSGMTSSEVERAISNYLERIRGDLGGDPRFYTTPDAAEDLDDVRAALGRDRIDLYGISYGATLAQEYARRYAEHVRTLTLDSGTLLDLPTAALIPRRSQEALASVFARCADDPACHASFPDPAADLGTAMRRLRSHPVTAEVDGGELELDSRLLASIVHELLKTGRSGLIPDLLGEVARGDTEELANLAAPLLDQPDPTELVVYWATACADAWGRLDRDLVAELGSGSYLLPNYLAAGRSWELGCGAYRAMTGLEPESAEPLVSDVPVLLLNSTEDPQDPPSNVADAPVELPNSLVVEVPGQGHGVGYLGCLPDVVAAFVEAGSAEGLDTGCVSELEPSSFAGVSDD
jgi:pimeloyl-ACP methyl ester carboxylesterase